MQCADTKGRARYPAWKSLIGKLIIVLLFFLCPGSVFAEEAAGSYLTDLVAPIEMHGFLELRAGYRTQKDSHEKDISVMETRLQAEFFTYTQWADFKYKADVWGDRVTEKGEYDTREAWFFSRPTDFLDIKVGRQVLTWGTGDLIFLNDLFPKDWQSYFIGRDNEYLKAPSDAAKFSLFMDFVNIDLVYTPQFDPDRYITGTYISHWNETDHRISGQGAVAAAHTPDQWFHDDEFAVRVYRNIHNYELALYGYHGFWKRPAGQTFSGEAIFPSLNVYGGSARGQLGPGIGNVEFAYYQSNDDKEGSKPLVNNSEIRYLVGYARDLTKDFNAALQYYIEQLLDYGAYKKNLTGALSRDQFRHLITLQLSMLLMNQNLELSMASYYSPSDKDVYLLPNIRYKWTDDIILETGANIFIGETPYTFFGQLEKNTNIYVAVKYSF